MTKVQLFFDPELEDWYTSEIERLESCPKS